MVDRVVVRVLIVFGLLAAAAAAGDLVHLKNGRLLHGRVVSESDESLVVELRAGRVTLPRRLVRAIERGAADRAHARQVTQRDEWFLVMHRDRLVGWRRIVHTEGPERIHVEERTVFFRDGGGTDVDFRRVEVVDRNGRPIEFLYAETYGRKTDMTTGQVVGDKVIVRVRRRGKLNVRELELEDGWTLALPAWSRFLGRARPGETKTIRALDLTRLRTVELVLRRESDARVDRRACRAVTLAGSFRPARAYYVPGEGSVSVELNGRTLVARRASRARVELARQAHAAPKPMSVQDAVVYPFVKREKNRTAVHVRGGLKATAPDAAWKPTLHDADEGLLLTFEKVSLFSAVDVFSYPVPREGRGDVDDCLENAIARLKLTAKSLRVVGEAESRTVGGLPARVVALRGTHRGETLRCRIAVVHARNRYVLLAAASPSRTWTWTGRDFDLFLRGLEIVP